ncbi:MAG: hypothetical protein IKA20_01955 [Clostridia bacterium]|nr:hypothetical protein [Clostridia bacterium]
MENKELIIPIHYRKYAAMREALERGGKNFDEQLQAKAEEWYQELIPPSEREQIEKQIALDDKAEAVKGKQFAVVRIRDEFEEYAFSTPRGESFFSIAKDYAEADKDEALKQYTVDTVGQRCFLAEGTLDESVYEVLCDSIKTNPLITAVVDFDLYEGTVHVLEQGYEDWKAYDLYTLTKAVENAEGEVGLTEQEREQVFRDNLDGEEIDMAARNAMGITPP